MHIILGGTGRVGSAVVQALLEQHAPVTVVTHSPDARPELEAKGADVAVVDVLDTDA
ncbi:MAG: NAD(P)H-binding protein, partial [Roseimicrobium sp.]